MRIWGAALVDESCERVDLEEFFLGATAMVSVCHRGWNSDCRSDAVVLSIQSDAWLG